MIKFFSSTLNPSGYHGLRKKAPFFEGWYFKLVDKTGQKRLAVIPGVYLANDNSKSHSFVQILDGETGHSSYHSYSFNEFDSRDRIFDISVGPNRFTSEYLKLDIDDKENFVDGELYFFSLKYWPVSLISPGIMGWYAWVPFMECYHGVVSLDHHIRGALKINNQIVDFTGGRGYSEKDWGKSFPSAWVWFQTNHFESPETSLTASIAIIPWIRKPFAGFIIGLLFNGNLYRFATYTGAQIEHFNIEDKIVNLAVRDKSYRLEVWAVKSEGGLLHAPSLVEMDRRISETLKSSVEVTLTEIIENKSNIIFHDIGKHAGMETNGDLDQLVNMWMKEK
jgi:hypothetical protein